MTKSLDDNRQNLIFIKNIWIELKIRKMSEYNIYSP